MKDVKVDKKIIIIVIALALLLILGTVLMVNNSKKASPKQEGTQKEEKITGKPIGNNDIRFYPAYLRIKDFVDESKIDSYKSFTGKELMEMISPDLETMDFTQNGDSYTIKLDDIRIYLKMYFPNDVQINGAEAVDKDYVYPVNNELGKGMTITDFKDDVFTVKFSDNAKEEEKQEGAMIFPRTVVSALITDKENMIVVTEKVIYVDKKEKDGKFIYTIYSDAKKENKIDQKELTKEEAQGMTIMAGNYGKMAATVTHKYKKDEKNEIYVFDSAKFSY